MKNERVIIPAEFVKLPLEGRVQHTFSDVAEEYFRARRKHAPMHSAHEGFAVIKEELDELWDEIKKRDPSKAAMRIEAIQLAAMAVSFVLEVCDN